METVNKDNRRAAVGEPPGGQTEDNGRPAAVGYGSDERLRALTANLADSITVVGRDGVILYDSPNIQRFLGDTVGELEGRNVFPLVHPDDLPLARGLFRELLREPGASRTAELRLRHRDGSWRYVEVIGKNLLANAGIGGIVLNSRDITARKQAEQELRASEQSYRLFAESIPVPAWRTNEKGQMVFCNRRWCEYTGQTPAQARGEGWRKALHPEDRTRTNQLIAKARTGGGLYEADYRLRRHDGVYRWHLARAYPMRNATGKVTSWFGTSTDTHDQRMARQELERLVAKRTKALRESEARYRNLLELAPAGLVVVAGLKIAYANTAFARIVDCGDPLELIDRPVVEFAHPEYRDFTLERLAMVLEKRQPTPLRGLKLVRPNGAVRDVMISSTPILYQGRPAALSVIRDVTDLRRLEREVAESSRRTQIRIGQDLHDTVCQDLIAIALACQALHHELAKRSSPLATQAGEIRNLLQKAAGETRALAQGLYPAELRGNNLPAALHQLGVTTERLFGVHCLVEASDLRTAPEPEQTAHLYRIAQEALHNAIKHGKVKHVRLTLTEDSGRLTLTVRDGGKGISGKALAGEVAGMGLATMRYRAETIGASLTIRRAESGGTIVTCSLPVPLSRRTRATPRTSLPRRR